MMTTLVCLALALFLVARRSGSSAEAVERLAIGAAVLILAAAAWTFVRDPGHPMQDRLAAVLSRLAP